VARPGGVDAPERLDDRPGPRTLDDAVLDGPVERRLERRQGILVFVGLAMDRG